MKRATAELSREVILAAAVRLMARHGFHGTSMRQLAAEVGCALSSLYNHFSSKDAILREIQERAFEALIARAETAVADAGTPAEKLHAFIDQHVRYVAQQPDLMRVLVHEAGALDAEGRRAVRERKERYFALGRQVLRAVLPAGRSDADVERVTYHLFAMVNWLWGWYEPDRHGDVKAITSSIHDLLAA